MFLFWFSYLTAISTENYDVSTAFHDLILQLFDVFASDVLFVFSIHTSFECIAIHGFIDIVISKVFFDRKGCLSQSW